MVNRRKMQIVGAKELAGAGRWALGELKNALEAKSWGVQDCDGMQPGHAIVIGLAESPAVQELLARAQIDVPDAPESLVIHKLNQNTLVVAGRDVRGLVYALTELARAIELSSEDSDPFAGVIEVVESPELKWRSMQLFLCNADLEREWYFRESFWDEYLGMLARCRYNNLSLTFAHQTSYLAPPYPFHVELPEFPQVRVPGLSQDERQRNLAMLRRISEMAQARALHFTLGVWSQHDSGYGAPMVEGLDEDIRAECNALGLRKLLEACPAIDGVQFRMNRESGVPEDEQLKYYEAQFRAIAECGRPICLDLRAKGLSNRTIERARELVPNTVVSTKFWCEHLGQPYVMPAIQRADVNNHRRYGAWDLLEKPRDWDLVYRLWSVGTQKILLWGDPEWVKRFVQSCRFGSVGFEVMAPLTNKGFGNKPGSWRVITDTSYQPYQEEYQRYWLFHLLFGRLGYNSSTSCEVWRRELRQQFGEAAEPIERAYRSAGGVMPLLTTVQQWSASTWRYWPELFAGRTLEQDINIEPSDPTQFYGVVEYVDDAMSRNLCGKWTPARVIERFRRLAADTTAALADARSTIANSEDTEFRSTELDFQLLAHMANYHADRLTTGTHLAFYQRTRQPGRLMAAREYMQQARQHWQALANLAAGIYNDNLVFGDFGRGHRGHWKDLIQFVDADIRKLEEMLNAIPSDQQTTDYQSFPGETAPAELLTIKHEPIKSASAGQPLILKLTVNAAKPIRSVCCYHRIANQSLPFQRREMGKSSRDFYRTTIPGDQIKNNWDLMVFFEVMLESGEGLRWPDWRSGPPYFVIETDAVPTDFSDSIIQP